jgi:alpha-D-ribose 1-methylphosphonate 5-triphosphate synthase subunit PhnH
MNMNMNLDSVPAAGLCDPVHDGQQSFRVALDAMARPGGIRSMGRRIPDLPLGAAMAHLLLTVTDEDTPVWWQSAPPQLRQWLRFHTGAATVAEAGEASFAVITAAATMPALAQFRSGTPAAPEQSCTLLVEVASLRQGPALQAHGPGIREVATLNIAGLGERFWAEWQASHAAFPQGVDIFFTCGTELLALPRTTRIARLQEV